MMIAGGMVMSLLAGCGKTDPASDQAAETEVSARVQEEESTEAPQTSETAAETKESPEETSTDADAGARNEAVQGGKTLVVYYSASGHTEDVAKVIADEAGADLFVLEPVEPYTSDDLNYTDDNSRVSKEHENEEQRKVEPVSAAVEDWECQTPLYGIIKRRPTAHWQAGVFQRLPERLQSVRRKTADEIQPAFREDNPVYSKNSSITAFCKSFLVSGSFPPAAFWSTFVT